MHKIYFTVDEANQMIPKLERAFLRIYQIKHLSQETFHRLDELGFTPQNEHFKIHPEGANMNTVSELAGLKILLKELRKQIEELTEEGCLVKDITIGLVDFFAKKRGKDIFLCWRTGEKAITHWHSVNSDFKGRKPLFKQAPSKKTFESSISEPSSISADCGKKHSH